MKTLLLLFAVTAGLLNSQSSAVFKKVFSGITTAQASAPVPNFGQTMHLIYVMFPGQTTTQSPLNIRIEASYDNVTYFGISESVSSAANVGGLVYDVQQAYGPWPYVRVRSLIAVPSPMTIWYAGHTIPAVTGIQDKPDRFIL